MLLEDCRLPEGFPRKAAVSRGSDQGIFEEPTHATSPSIPNSGSIARPSPTSGSTPTAATRSSPSSEPCSTSTAGPNSATNCSMPSPRTSMGSPVPTRAARGWTTGRSSSWGPSGSGATSTTTGSRTSPRSIAPCDGSWASTAGAMTRRSTGDASATTSALLSPDTIERLNHLIVAEGHRLVPEAAETVRGDSFVVATDVHYPTDSEPHRRRPPHDRARRPDAWPASWAQGGWRQHRHLLRAVKKHLRAINRIAASKGRDFRKRLQDAYRALLDAADRILARATELLDPALIPDRPRPCGEPDDRAAQDEVARLREHDDPGLRPGPATRARRRSRSPTTRSSSACSSRRRS